MGRGGSIGANAGIAGASGGSGTAPAWSDTVSCGVAEPGSGGGTRSSTAEIGSSAGVNG